MEGFRLQHTATTEAAIAALLRRYGLVATRLRCVARLEVEVWRIAVRGEEDVSLRIYPSGALDRAPIETEIAWLRALADDGLHVPRPLTDAEGACIQAWEPDPAGELRHAVLMSWLGGRLHDRGLTPERLRRIGVMTARMHRAADRLAADGGVTTRRAALDIDLPDWARGRSSTAVLTRDLAALARATARRLLDEIATFPRGPEAWGFIHGDLHPWNIVFARDQAGAIDFSECGWGHRATDLASTLQYLKHPLAGNHDHRAEYGRLLDSLLAGYAGTRALPPQVERQIAVFVVARCVGTLAWIVDDWPAADHRAWGPRFLRGVGQIFGDYLASPRG